MNQNTFDKVIQKTPIIKYIDYYKKNLEFLRNSQWWDKEKIEEYQLQRIIKLLKHSHKNVPYYKKIFNERKINVKNIKNFEDFKELPFLTRKIVMDNFQNFKSTNYRISKFSIAYTGGSTGIPLKFCTEKYFGYLIDMIFFRMLLDRIGCNFKDKFVYLRGAHMTPLHCDGILKYFLMGKCLQLPSFNMTDENLHRYYKKIKNFQPKFIITYPSSITIFTKFMDRYNYKPLHSVKAIICGTENLYENQRKYITEFFQCRIFDIYGLAEGVALGGGCEKSNNFHFFPEYGFVELLGKNNHPVKKDGEFGEIVGTGFYNDIFPFIRYRTGDIGVYSSNKCECGRNHFLIKRIDGRIQEFIVTKKGEKISFRGAYNLMAKFSSNIKESQIIQYIPGEIVIRIVRDEKFSNSDIDIIIKNFKKNLFNNVKISIDYVDHIKRTSKGKYNFFIQRLS